MNKTRKLALLGFFLTASVFAQERSQDPQQTFPPFMRLPLHELKIALAPRVESLTMFEVAPRPSFFPGLAPRLKVQPQQQHKFWDHKTKFLFGSAAALVVADVWTTRRIISRGGHEFNPMARPFAGSDAAFAAYRASSWGVYLGLSYLCHRKGWHRLEIIVPAVLISIDGAAVANNLARVF